MNKNTILLSLATYVVATAVLLVGVSALGLMPRDGVDGKDVALKIYVASKSLARTCSGAFDDDCGSESYFSVTARCKSGDTVLGGGIKQDDKNPAPLAQSYADGNAWTVEVVQHRRPSTVSITAYAICQDNPWW